MDRRHKEVWFMKTKLTGEDVMEMRRLFWAQQRGEITPAERETEVNKIADRQMNLPVEEQEMELTAR